MKRVICTVVALVMVLALAACGGGGNGPDATVKKFSEAMKTFDINKMKECLADASGMDDLDMDLEGSEKALLDLMKEWSSKLKYKIGEVKTDGDKATVKADYTYTDASEVITAAFKEYISKAMAAAFSGQEVTEEAMTKLLFDCIEEAKKTAQTKEANQSVTFQMIKDGETWKIKEFDPALANVLSCNMMGVIENMFGGLGN